MCLTFVIGYNLACSYKTNAGEKEILKSINNQSYSA